MAGSARPRHHPVLDELPDPDDRLAHRPVADGFFSNWFQDIGLRDSNLQVLDTRFAVQLAVVYNYLPLMIFPLFVALDRLDPALREASKDLGANRIRTFFQVTLPLAAPGIVAGLLLVFIPLSGDYITAAVLGGAQGNMAGALVATQFLQAQNKALARLAVAMVLIISILVCIAVAALLVFIVRTLLKRRRAVTLVPPGLAQARRDHGHDPHQARQGQDHRGGAAQRRRFDTVTLGLGLWSVLVYVFLFLPIAFVVIHSFTDSRDFTRWGGFTTRWYGRFLDNFNLKTSLTNSIKVALIATLISVVLGGSPGSRWPAGPVFDEGFLAAVFLILVTPEIVDAIGLQIWFVNLGGLFRQGLFPLWIGQSIFSSAVVTLIVRARMAGLDESLEEAAADSR